mmetsp:Transcript_43456/g.131417  ORF Transcript_43456/g.131417 Transcript_43456/m.131417 type:complete len:367 (-) Transcript_43456:306-1406(-)
MDAITRHARKPTKLDKPQGSNSLPIGSPFEKNDGDNVIARCAQQRNALEIEFCPLSSIRCITTNGARLVRSAAVMKSNLLFDRPKPRAATSTRKRGRRGTRLRAGAHQPPKVPILRHAPALGILACAWPMLLAIHPLATEDLPIWPSERTLAGLPPGLPAAFVPGAIGHLERALAIHSTGFPLAEVLLAIRVRVTTFAMHHIAPELPGVLGPGGVLVDAPPVLHATPVLALVPRAVGPALGAEPGLGAIRPLAFVRGPIRVDVRAIPVPLARCGTALAPTAFRVYGGALVVAPRSGKLLFFRGHGARGEAAAGPCRRAILLYPMHAQQRWQSALADARVLLGAISCPWFWQHVFARLQGPCTSFVP